MASEQAAAIGTRLRRRREELGWTRRHLANQTDGLATENDIYRWESGKHRPQDDTLAALARAMQRDFAWALGEAERAETPDLSLDGQPTNADLAEMIERLVGPPPGAGARAPAAVGQPTLADILDVVRDLENQIRLLRADLQIRSAEEAQRNAEDDPANQLAHLRQQR